MSKTRPLHTEPLHTESLHTEVGRTDVGRPARARGALALAGALLTLLGAARCAVNPATGRPQLALIGEGEEVSLGRQNHQQILSSMGAYSDPALQNYVASLGRELARRSERPQLPWTFTVVDDPAVNAFAVPGGYVYVTRGILANINSEAELVGVLGHEIGHVTARHSVEQMSRAQLANIGLAVGSVVAPEIQEMGQLVQTGVGLLFLKYSRDDENQADELGVRYMTREGYPASSLAEILGVLERVGKAEGSSTPDWLSTHPNPRDRVVRVRALAQRNPVAQPRANDRNAFVSRLRGLPYGSDPREGYFEGDYFFAPALGIQMEIPGGWKKQNTREALLAASPDGAAAIQVTLAKGRSARAAAEQFFANQSVQAGEARGFQSDGFDGLDVPFAAQAQGGGRVVGRALFVQDGSRVYQILGYGIESRLGRGGAAIERSLDSFGPLRDSCRANVEPARIEVVQAQRGMTLADLGRGGGADLNAVAIMNHLEPGAPLQPGVLYKRIVGGNNRCGRFRG